MHGSGRIGIPFPDATDISSPEHDPLHGFERRFDIRSRQLGLDLALYDPATSSVYILNPLDALLWQHIGSERTLKSIHEMLWLAYADDNLSPERLMGDLRGAVREFKSLNLIVPEGSPRRAPGGSTGEQVASVQITERSLSKSSCGYQPPALQTASLAQLSQLAQLPAAFADVWVFPSANALEP